MSNFLCANFHSYINIYSIIILYISLSFRSDFSVQIHFIYEHRFYNFFVRLSILFFLLGTFCCFFLNLCYLWMVSSFLSYNSIYLNINFNSFIWKLIKLKFWILRYTNLHCQSFYFTNLNPLMIILGKKTRTGLR